LKISKSEILHISGAAFGAETNAAFGAAHQLELQ
jgi:hypothetical protein